MMLRVIKKTLPSQGQEGKTEIIKQMTEETNENGKKKMGEVE